ncbi:Hypothetical predicted protein, partial [Podarcis lilfordi]
MPQPLSSSLGLAQALSKRSKCLTIPTYQFIRNGLVNPGNKIAAVILGQIRQTLNGAELELNGTGAQGAFCSVKDHSMPSTEIRGLNVYLPMRSRRIFSAPSELIRNRSVGVNGSRSGVAPESCSKFCIVLIL